MVFQYEFHIYLTQLSVLFPRTRDSGIPSLMQKPSEEPFCSSIHDIHLYTDEVCLSLDTTGGSYSAYPDGQKIIPGDFRLQKFYCRCGRRDSSYSRRHLDNN
ncbi:hypothetical protein GcC1_166017 [Golovinomyces cichoracearum]|uniref:Uncharacterized protein n=1 Tax=Golovinomyces cichoracearum TaxID=62708 RepID=A0A420HSJ7_9PEZI|nr:hypothetical protein GcC1_166017 [Golovinomyces cichoracearum]